MPQKTIYAIVLNYNCFEDTVECIESFRKIREFTMKVLLIDNASESKVKTKIKKYADSIDYVTFIETGLNLGYAGGNNIGIKYAIEHGAEYIAIVNNDTKVNETTFNDCIRILDNEKDVAFVGPTIVDYNSKLIQYTGGTIDYLKMDSPHLNYHKPYVPSKDVVVCDYIGGACMVFKPEIIDEIGLIPECYFLLWEETEWCTKAIKAKKKCLCTLDGYIEHKGSVSIKKIDGISAYYFERNRVIFSIRNDERFMRRFLGLLILCCKCVLKAIIRDKKYLNYIAYYYDGFMGRDKYKHLREKIE